jgi:hypothetical protein
MILKLLKYKCSGLLLVALLLITGTIIKGNQIETTEDNSQVDTRRFTSCNLKEFLKILNLKINLISFHFSCGR